MFGSNTNLDWFLTKEQTVNTHREENSIPIIIMKQILFSGIKEYKAKKKKK